MRLTNSLQISASHFENHDVKPAVFHFYCSCCSALNHVCIEFFQISEHIVQLTKSLSMSENELAVQLNLRHKCLSDLRFFAGNCVGCKQTFVVVFNSYEPNNNRFVCDVMGVWNYEV